MMKYDVSIIIVSYNCADELRDCLVSIEKETKNITYEVIVVDNVSVDDTRSMLHKEFPDVFLIENNKNVGFASGNNQGLERAQGEYILFLNPDTIVLDHAVEKLLTYSKSNPTVGLVGPFTLNADGSVQPTVFYPPTLQGVFHTHIPLWRIIPFYKPATIEEFVPARTSSVAAIKGCCMMGPTSVIRSIGGMNPTYFMYSEEVELCENVRERGLQVVYFKEASIIHLEGRSTGVGTNISDEKRLAMVVERVRSLKKFFQRHYPHSSLTGFRLLFIFGSMWRYVLWWFAGFFPAYKQVSFIKTRDHKAMLQWFLYSFNEV